MFILYFAIGLIATVFGAVAGLGGGVIIKPVLDLFGDFDLPTIGVLSAATVLSMAAVSLIKLRNKEVKIDKGTSSILAAGSILGGLAGKAVFNVIAISLNVPTITAIIQSTLLAILLTLILIYFKKKHNLKSYLLKNGVIIFLVGGSLGFLSAFLGIGGGPLNVAILCILFSMSTKNAGVNSIFIIFFSQLSALLLIAFSGGFGDYDLSMLYVMIPGGILGGWIGSNIVTKITNSQVEKIFNIAILIIIFINLFNIVKVAFL
ncbi:sulfite exporter TauE/SafE family protein [Cytobacillus gottheilii]|uniref:sulfite exporter TauE/SafE family protein n=1 Tax=Cytobacillus gottheilii TaxID=859144 RepID=UPI000829B54E|nr:sulfite exporter TauE/SafE family protein [Cytobacillus gottheilii]